MLDRLAVLKVLERGAAVLRRAGLGRVVDRSRERALRGLGPTTVEVHGLRLGGEMRVHGHYLRELVDEDREGYMVELFGEAVRPGGLAVDVGAYLGLFSLLAARAGSEVVAFEPNPETLRHLRANLAANLAAARVTVVEKAVAAESGRRAFHLDASGDTSSLHPQPGSQRRVEVDSVAADDVIAGRPVDVIKIDVEGAELEALAGLEATIRAAGPGLRLFVECNPPALEAAGASEAALLERLHALGLEVGEIDEAAREVRPFRGAGERPYVNLLAVPRPAA